MGKQHSETISQSITGLSSRFRLGTTTNYVATQLRNMIMEDQYAHNERLPSERYLAEQFQVSRGTIRAVLQVLEDQQVVTRQIGSGTYVNLQNTSNQYEISNIINPIEIVEVRIAVEPQMVRFAIANASYRDLEIYITRLVNVRIMVEIQRILFWPTLPFTSLWQVVLKTNYYFGCMRGSAKYARKLSGKI